MTESIDGNVCTAASDLHYCGDRIVSFGIDGRFSPDRCRKFEFMVGNVDGDNACAKGDGDHDCRKTDAATAVNCYPLAFRNLALIHDGTVRGRETAAKRRGSYKIDLFGQADEVC